jgi:hypothetical protein
MLLKRQIFEIFHSKRWLKKQLNDKLFDVIFVFRQLLQFLTVNSVLNLKYLRLS